MEDNLKKQQMFKWVQSWKKAGPALAEIRKQELRQIDTQQALKNLSDAFESCTSLHLPRCSSGLVEQQKWFYSFRNSCD